MLTYADVCRRMSTYADVCRRGRGSGQVAEESSDYVSATTTTTAPNEATRGALAL